MIIDSHLHLGSVIQFDLLMEQIQASMQRYGVAKAVLSNIEGVEFDSNLRRIPQEKQKSQHQVNQKTLEYVQQNPAIFKGLYWIKPHTEGYSGEVEDFLRANRDYFAGFKAHPYHSKLKFTDERYRPYLECAQQNQLVVVVHTAMDEYSRPELVYEVAKDYPKVSFVLVHMGLGTEQEEAIQCIQALPNLYGDTTWVKWENVVKAVQACGSERIIFGTDSPIAFEEVQERYLHDLKMLAEHLSAADLDNLLYQNAQKLFW